VSTLLHPSGPEPASVYWIRRGAILAVLLTVLVLLWWALGALFGGGDDTSGGPAAQPSATASASPGESPAASASPETTTAAEPVACLDSAILVEATTDASTYPVGATPKLTLTITNTGEVDCKRDVGPKANELEITSGGYHVWSSDDCNASDKTKVVTLKAGEQVASSITWNGRLSQKGCPDDGEGAMAKAGSYNLVGRNGKVTSEPTPFALSNKS
jgi:hypothetical protein